MKIKTLKTAQSEIHQLSFYLKLYTALLFLGLAVTPLDSPAASQLARIFHQSGARRI